MRNYNKILLKRQTCPLNFKGNINITISKQIKKAKEKA